MVEGGGRWLSMVENWGKVVDDGEYSTVLKPAHSFILSEQSDVHGDS